MLITSLLLTVLAQTAPTVPVTPADAPATSPGPALPPNLSPAPDRGWIPLFNGENLDGWYPFRQRDGKNNDVQHVFKVENGTIHVLDVPDPATSQPNGYLATNEDFRNYRVRLEYKWGMTKFAVPRHPDGLPRDAGLLYHMTGPDQVWPICVEFQIQEHDTGDVWLLPNNPPNPSANVTVVSTDVAPRGNLTYMEGGTPWVSHGQRIIHSAQYDAMDGWNTVELFVTENNAVHVVNGHVNNTISNLQLPNNAGPMDHGKILLQEENNEVFYRKIEIKPLFVDHFGGPPFKVLLVTDPAAKPEATQPAIAAMQTLGKSTGFTLEAAKDISAFTDDNLKQYQAVAFWGTTGGALNAAQRQAFEKYIRSGGGFVGVNAAQAASDWDWYDQLVGAKIDTTSDGINASGISLNDANHPATSSLPLKWTHKEYVPYFNLDDRAKVHVLATAVDAENPDAPSSNPAAWCHDVDSGRSFFTTIGGAKDDLTNPLVLMHLLGGIMYAAHADGSPLKGAVVLFDGTDTSHWLGKDNATFPWLFHDGVIEPPPAANSRVMVGDIHSKETFDDMQVHVEFKVPGTKSPETRDTNTNEQARGNSGIYLQGHYECQILDSYDHPLEGKNDEGAIYEVKDADVNASLPAEVWQTYDIIFHAPKWQDGKKFSNAHITSYLNGVLVQKDTEVPGMTRSGVPEAPGPGPLTLQDHLNAVQFRKVWVLPLTETK